MKHIFKKLHKGNNHDPNRSNETLTPPLQSPTATTTSDHRSHAGGGGGGGGGGAPTSPRPHPSSSFSTTVNNPSRSPSSSPSRAGVVNNTSSAASTSPAAAGGGGREGDYMLSEEEFQVQLAMAISASNSEFRGDDPEKDQIRAATLLSLGGHRSGDSGREKGEISAETQSRQYWEYNVLDYEEKVVDGFYDAYGLSTDSRSQGKMPSLAELERNPESSSFEVIIVNCQIDRDLEELIQIAQCVALDCPASRVSTLVQRLAEHVTNYMGGAVKDASIIWSKWMDRSTELRTSLHTCVLPIGSVKIGLLRHRALLFKVLADSINLPCRLVKGSYYTGIEDAAINIIKLDDEREFLVDLMADPGTLIPADSSSTKENKPYSAQISKMPSFHSPNDSGLVFSRPRPSSGEGSSKSSNAESEFHADGRLSSKVLESFPSSSGAAHDPNIGTYRNSNIALPNQLDGVPSSPTGTMMNKGIPYSHAAGNVTKMNVNIAPQNRNSPEDPKYLFADLNPFLTKGLGKAPVQKNPIETRNNPSPGRPPLPLMLKNQYAYNDIPRKREYDYEESSFSKNSRDATDYKMSSSISSSSVKDGVFSHSSESPNNFNSSREENSWNPFYDPNSVSASFMPSSEHVTTQAEEGSLRVQVDAQTVIADIAKRCDQNEGYFDSRKCINDRFMGANMKLKDPERSSPVVSNTTKIGQVFDDVDVGECEIQWEQLVLGERIGLGSYGEVYRADCNGTEVAVKKFLDQDFSGAALDEFKREVRIMRRLRHPNVVRFVGAVTRPPNLSIITEFLPRGSLYRIIHRPNCQIDEKRRIKMALDVARGMNCLHTSIPTIVHRDLKSPNLLVDKNWNVKVCDFGLSRLKHNTFLSSKSTAGTPEWMAPEVLRNEPSNEKCDVYSFGVILWELATMKLPWSGMNPMQVVGAVGFQNRRLDIPKEVDPLVARIILQCWQTEPNLRPSFAELAGALESLQRLVIPSHHDQTSLSLPQERLDQRNSSLSANISVNTTP